MSLKSPLGRVLGLGSAKDGTSHWWSQRLSAAGLVLLGLWFAGALAGMQGFDYASARALLGDPVNAVLMALLVATALYHSMLGVQVVIEDYVHQGAAKVGALVVVKFVHVLAGALGVFAVLRVGFGA